MKSLAAALIQNLVRIDTETNMKTYTLVLPILLATVLSGCASMYDSQDLCQNYYNKPNYEYPSHCGASAGTRYITRDYQTGRPLTTTKAQK